jgi:hypothetical protein
MPPRRLNRDTEISKRPQVQKQLLEVFEDVELGFQDQRERCDGILDNWDLYNQKLTDKQFYNGNSQIFLPYVVDAVDARGTRFVNQIFPQSGRYVDVTSGEEQLPMATMALLESYVRKCKLKTEVMPPLVVNGDVEGQYSLYVSWLDQKRSVTRREMVADTVIGRGAAAVEFPELGEHEEINEEDERLAHPAVEVIHDADLLVLPVTAASIDDAIESGGSVTVLRRWTKTRIRQAIREGDIDADAGDVLIKAMGRAAKDQNRNTGDRLLDAAGVKNNGKEALIYETWTKLRIDGGDRLCVAFYGGDDNVLGCRRCPYWCERAPVLSVPVKKQTGVFKGKPPVDKVADLQILANDTINEAADTAHFSAMPIVMTDPEKNPKVSSMVLGLAAVWETSPNDTQFAEFPRLWENGMARAQACQAQIFQTLGVNPAMIPQGTGGENKRNQAEIANEQQVDLLTTADACGVLEEGILTPLLQRFADYDHQFRDEDATVAAYGELGVRARMETVTPIQLNNRWEYTWLGVEQARNAAQLQQQIAGMNILKGIPPALYKGYRMNLAPLVESMSLSLFGPRMAPLVLVKEDAITLDPVIENGMLENGFQVMTHEADDDQMHLLEHTAAMQEKGGVDPHGTFRDHIAMHQAQMQAKQAQQTALMASGPGTPGSPGGMGMPGSAGTPPGAQPGQPMGAKGPPGMIHADEMPAAGAVPMPRNM